MVMNGPNNPLTGEPFTQMVYIAQTDRRVSC